MKKYILFQFEAYYPRGGLNDITGSFETIDEARAFIELDPDPFNFNEVVDRDTWQVVAKKNINLKTWEYDDVL